MKLLFDVTGRTQPDPFIFEDDGHFYLYVTALPGVGRKTANVVLGNVFRKPSIVVDTHVGRIARRLQFTDYTDPVKVEFELMKKIPEDHWILINLQWIAFGREICSARKPDCENCFLTEFCREHDKKKDKTK